jgi:hypothetical protein
LIVSRARLRSDPGGSINPGWGFVEMLARRIDQRLESIDWTARAPGRTSTSG